jgi:hypothetical protein
MRTTQTNLAALAREHRKQERLGDDDTCHICGETDIRALRQIEPASSMEGTITVALCASCHVQLQGKQPTEEHHPAGRANDPFTVPVPATDHAVLTDWQYDWPRGTWRNPDGSPLLRAAASLRGWLDILRLLIERTMGWIPAFLEHLDTILRQQLGEGWRTAYSLEGAPR